MTALWFIILSVIAILILITFHELGHFLAAIACRVKVKRFVVGLGKPRWVWRGRSGTEYGLALIPLGGYVKLLDDREAPVAESELPYTFNHKAWWQRLVIVFAGPLMNWLLALIGVWAVLTMGYQVSIPMISKVIANSPVAVSGVPAQSEIIAIDGEKTPDWPSVSMTIVKRVGDDGTMQMQVQKRGRLSTHSVDLKQWRIDPLQPRPLRSLGIVPLAKWQPREINYSWYGAVKPAFVKTWDYTEFNFVMLYKLVVGDISIKSIAGPITIFEMTFSALEQGVVVSIWFLSLLSIILAVMNLLPIPGLDGAQICYVIYESITRKRVSVGVQVLLFRLGVIAIVLLLIQALTNDILRLLS